MFLALRSNDKAGVDDALKTRISFDKPRHSTGGVLEIATPLHLAVQCAPTSMVDYLLSRHKLDLSAGDYIGISVLWTLPRRPTPPAPPSSSSSQRPRPTLNYDDDFNFYVTTLMML